MKDEEIVALFHRRDEQAIKETQKKYSRLLLRIASNILGNDEDARECENDVYLHLWNAIPPAKPSPFMPYLCAVCRHLALNRYGKRTAVKRGGGQTSEALDELADCIPDAAADDPAEMTALRDLLDAFLDTLPEKERNAFLKRYWFMAPVPEIAREMHISRGHADVLLFRAREKLKAYLEKEGYKNL